MPLFSVIVPTFNRLDLLKVTIHSILSQRHTDFELIVVDDGSRDDTLEYLKALGSPVTVLRQSNQGPGSARNRGAQTAAGKFLAFLDSDDVWFPWTLDVYREAIDASGEPVFLVGKPELFVNESDLSVVKRQPVVTNKFDDYLKSGDKWRWWGVSSFVIRRDAFNAVGGFVADRVNGEDADLALRLGVAPGFVEITAPVTFGYREHTAHVKDDMERTVSGIRHALTSEKRNRYPGGMDRAKERWEILTRHVRPVAMECLRNGRWRDAWEFYSATFAWNLSLGRLRYLVGFPLMAFVEFGRHRFLSE